MAARGEALGIFRRDVIGCAEKETYISINPRDARQKTAGACFILL